MSTDTTSPSLSSTCDDGMPWTISSLTEVQGATREFFPTVRIRVALERRNAAGLANPLLDEAVDIERRPSRANEVLEVAEDPANDSVRLVHDRDLRGRLEDHRAHGRPSSCFIRVKTTDGSPTASISSRFPRSR